MELREQQEYIAGIYCRLSSEDGPDHESMSIANQRDMLSDYVKRQGWTIGEVYVDASAIIGLKRRPFCRVLL